MKYFFIASTIASAIALSGCATAGKILADLGASPLIAKIGTDLVTLDCSLANTVQVAATDAKASGRVQAILAANASIAKDLCPLLTAPDPTIQINAPAPIAANATPAVTVIAPVPAP